MAELLFSGAYTAIVTPFNENGSIDYESLGVLVRRQIANNITGIVVLGTTGESPAVDHDEHNEVIRFVINAAEGRVQVIAGTGSNATREAIKYSEQAAEDGADGLLLVNPYYNKPTQRGLYMHFKEIADAVDIPQILYNIEGRSGVNLETETLLRLAEHDNIVAVKEASGDINQMMDVISRVPNNFSVLSGDDNLTYPLLALGGHGVVSVVSNIVPLEVVRMVSAALDGDLETARDMHYRLLPLMKACFLETNPIPIKTMLAMRGYIDESFRLPMCGATAENREKLAEILSRYC